MPVRDVNVGDRVMYDGEVCEVLRVDRPASAPVKVLVAELIDPDGDGRPYGARAWATQAELEPVVLENQDGEPIAGDVEVPTEAGEVSWGELADNIVELLDGHGVKPSDVPELGTKGLVKLKGIGKATAAKILEAVGVEE